MIVTFSIMMLMLSVPPMIIAGVVRIGVVLRILGWIAVVILAYLLLAAALG